MRFIERLYNSYLAYYSHKDARWFDDKQHIINDRYLIDQVERGDITKIFLGDERLYQLCRGVLWQTAS